MQRYHPYVCGTYILCDTVSQHIGHVLRHKRSHTLRGNEHHRRFNRNHVNMQSKQPLECWWTQHFQFRE